jgi:hypothetical protein
MVLVDRLADGVTRRARSTIGRLSIGFARLASDLRSRYRRHFDHIKEWLMKGSIALRRAPSLREAHAALRQVHQALKVAGAAIDSRYGSGLDFQMPGIRSIGLRLPWIVSRGRVDIGAWDAGPWKLTFELSFARLRWIVIGACAAITIALRNHPSGALFVLVVGALAYLLTVSIIVFRFRDLLRGAAREFIERRSRPRLQDRGSV